MIQNDLAELRDKYGDDRRTEITGEVGRVNMRGPDRRGGQRRHHQPQRLHQAAAAEHLPHASTAAARASPAAATREDDFIEHFFVASTHAYLLCFTNRGQLYWLKVYDIPQMSRTSVGPGHRQRAVAQAGGEDHQRHPGAALRAATATC